jgi:hypothetical protein
VHLDQHFFQNTNLQNLNLGISEKDFTSWLILQTLEGVVLESSFLQAKTPAIIIVVNTIVLK